MRIAQAPSKFDGTLDELYERWAKSLLLSPSVVEQFHTALCAYLETPDPLFLVRAVREQERGEIRRTQGGAQLRPTDNSPAWWIYYQLRSATFERNDSFERFVASVPCHMFETQRRIPNEFNVNLAGWHVAHIYDVKDRNVRFESWTRRELVRRTIRNIHPCNYFFVPRVEWQRHGGNPAVLAYFYDRFKSMYQSVWSEFIRLAEGTALPVSTAVGQYKYVFPTEAAHGEAAEKMTPHVHAAVKYVFSRLCFRADLIEPLDMEQTFSVVTPNGTFTMAKRDFYETFPNVLESRSYRESGIYHYPTTPQKALRFKIS